MNINDLTDEELARAADLYLTRIVRRMHALEMKEYFSLSITASGRISYDSTTISHKISYDMGEGGQKWEGNNLSVGLVKIRTRLIEDAEYEPMKVQFALEAPKEPEGEIAEFIELPEADAEA